MINIFNKKYTVKLINSKWEVIKTKITLTTIPNKGEYIFMDGKYFNIINVVHVIENEHKVLIIIDETNSNILEKI